MELVIWLMEVEVKYALHTILPKGQYLFETFTG